jgi:hypothetical protein
MLLASVVAAWGATANGPRAGGQNVAVDDLRRKQETQQRAAELARELVKNLLDVQMQQLEENGLTDRPLYTDVKTMRENIDGLVEAEMTEVVSLLLKAQGDTSERRDESFLAARQKIGEVLAGLLAERQNLSRRLRTAEIAAQVRRLIDVESVVRDDTSTLPMQTREQRELKQLATLADQRDAGKLYGKLLETLGEARGWGGEIARTAVDGLSLLKAGETGEHVAGAAASLESGDFTAAVEHESAAIRGLQVLLKKVKETQGLIEADRKAALEVVRELMRRQDELTDATKALQADQAAQADQAKQEELLKKQSMLGRDLTKLADMVLDKPQAAPLVERAEKASETASVELFNSQPAQAAKSQAMVRASLAAVEKQLQEETESALPDDRDAARLAQRAADLEKVREELKQARAKVAPLVKPETALPPTTKTTLDQTAKDVARAGHERDLPTPTAAKIREAARAARDAAKAQDDPSKSAEAKREEIAKADAALERAQADVEAAVADVRRAQPAVAAAELSRAAEALDRAAAAEREVAMKAAAEAAKPAKDADREAIAQLTDDHRLAAAVADDVAAAVGEQSPEAKQALAEAKAAAAEATKQLTMPNEAGAQSAMQQPAAQQPNAPQANALQPNAQQPGANTPAGAQAPKANPAGSANPSAANKATPENNANPQSKTGPEGTSPAAPMPAAPMPAATAGGDNKSPGEPPATQPASQPASQQNPAGENAPNAAVTPTPQALRNAAAQANAAAQKMTAAATQLRRQAAAQAGNLIKEAEKQLAVVTPAAKGVEQAATANNMHTAEAQAAVAAAQRAVETAEAEQMRAAGRPEAAELHELAAKIDQAATMQQAADAAAKKPARDPSESLDAVTMQQQAADETEKLLAQAEARPAAKNAAAQRKPDALVEPLKAAQRSAQEAARQTLAGKPAEAMQARADAVEALKQAAAAAKAEQAETAKKPPTGKVDPAAQQRATAAIAEAKKNAMAHAPLSTPSLDKAEKDSMAAEQAGLAAKSDETAEKQAAVGEKLAEAKKALEAAAAQLAAQGAEQMKKQAEATGKLAEQAAAVDPDALSALREAQQAAQGAAVAEPKPMPAAAAAARKEAAQSMQRAAASLAAREETVRRDQQLGQAMLASLAEQAQAAQDIAAQRGALAQAAAQMQAAPPAGAQAQPAAQSQARAAAETAARKLDEAMESFSQNAQVTGQAAQEVSGQNQIANPALAMALEKASGLPTPAMPEGAPQSPAGEAAPGEPAGAQQAPGAGAPPPPTRPAENATGLQPPGQMGKGFTPNSPETTAKMMAGPQAMQQMTQLAQGSTPPKPGSAPGQMPNTAAAPQANAGQPGQSTQASNSPQEQQNRPSQQARDSGQPFVNNSARIAADTTVAARMPAADEPWMAKLPAELRNAIRAEAQRPAPRGYEERLRNYFKNID